MFSLILLLILGVVAGIVSFESHRQKRAAQHVALIHETLYWFIHRLDALKRDYNEQNCTKHWGKHWGQAQLYHDYARVTPVDPVNSDMYVQSRSKNYFNVWFNEVYGAARSYNTQKATFIKTEQCPATGGEFKIYLEKQGVQLRIFQQGKGYKLQLVYVKFHDNGWAEKKMYEISGEHNIYRNFGIGYLFDSFYWLQGHFSKKEGE